MKRQYFTYKGKKHSYLFIFLWQIQILFILVTKMCAEEIKNVAKYNSFEINTLETGKSSFISEHH